MQNELRHYYENEGAEELRIQKDGVQYTEFLTITKYLDRLLPTNSKVLDPCAGTGVYSFHLADMGHKVVAGDLFEVNINKLKLLNEERKKYFDKNLAIPLENIYLGDVRDLSQFEEESFDCVLCMGALYHMLEEEDRMKSVESCLRVLKKGGILVATYINRLAAILGSCRGDIEDLEELFTFLKEGKEGVFYAHNPDEIKRMFEDFSIEELYHIGADGVGYLLYGGNQSITFEGLKRWRELHFATCENPYILGYSYHGAFFGRKI